MDLQIGDAVGNQAGAGKAVPVSRGRTVGQFGVRADLEEDITAVLYGDTELVVPGYTVSGGLGYRTDGGIQALIIVRPPQGGRIYRKVTVDA